MKNVKQKKDTKCDTNFACTSHKMSNSYDQVLSWDFHLYSIFKKQHGTEISSDFPDMLSISVNFKTL